MEILQIAKFKKREYKQSVVPFLCLTAPPNCSVYIWREIYNLSNPILSFTSVFSYKGKLNAFPLSLFSSVVHFLDMKMKCSASSSPFLSHFALNSASHRVKRTGLKVIRHSTKEN